MVKILITAVTPAGTRAELPFGHRALPDRTLTLGRAPQTLATQSPASRQRVEEEAEGGDLAVPGDDEIGSGVSRRLAGASRHPTDPSSHPRKDTAILPTAN